MNIRDACENGADVNKKSFSGETPLSNAVQKNHQNIIAFLKSKEAR